MNPDPGRAGDEPRHESRAPSAAVVLVGAVLGAAAYALQPLLLPADQADRGLIWSVGCLCAFVAYQVFFLIRAYGYRGFVSPVFAMLAVGFFVTLGVTSLPLMNPDSYVRQFLEESSSRGDFSANITNVVRIGLLAAVLFSVGTVVGRVLARQLRVGRLMLGDLARRGDPRVRSGILTGFLVAAAGLRFIQISLGVFGYAADINQLQGLANITLWLTIGTTLGPLAMLVAVGDYALRPSVQSRGLAMLAFGLEMTAGVLSGTKGGLVLPVVQAGLLFMVVRRRGLVRVTLATLSIIPIAYLVIEPFRNVRNDDPLFNGASVTGIASAVQTSLSPTEGGKVGLEARYDVVADNGTLQLISDAVIFRLNQSAFASIALQLADEGRVSDSVRSSFRFELEAIPALVVIPRFLWPTKPHQNIGRWFTETLTESWLDETESATAMSPIGYLYIAGGLSWVLFWYFAAGVFAAALEDGLITSTPGMVLLLLLQLGFAFPESAFYSYFTLTIQSLLVLVVAVRLVYVADPLGTATSPAELIAQPGGTVDAGVPRSAASLA